MQSSGKDDSASARWAHFEADGSPEAMKFGGWQRLNADYAKQFGIEAQLAASGAQKS
jgi:hypothetical protein